MKKRLNFKDAAGRTVFVSVELENGKLSMSGSVAGHHGQCQDEIKPANEDQRRLIEIWKDWHLNYLHDGLEAELSDICERIGEYKEPEFTGSYTFDVPGIGKIEASVKHVGAEIKWGHTKQKHRVKVFFASFDYWAPEKIDSVQDLAQAVSCFFSDALAYAQADDIDDFMYNFGYEKPSEALKAYNACKSTFEDAQSMGYGESEICDILNYLSEEWEC